MVAVDVEVVVKLIGSDNGSDIILKSRYVAPNHARIISEGDKIFIEDLGSVFGTYVKGRKISVKTELKSKDKVKLGAVALQWDLHMENQINTEKNPIYIRDLFLINGYVNWRDYQYILLLTLGAIIIVPLAIPLFLAFLELKSKEEISKSMVLQISLY